MLNKTAAGTYAPLLALGFAAAVGGCATQEDVQPDPFNSAPVIEAIYAHDNQYGSTLGLYDVQMYANPSDPHFPTATGVTGAQNAANVGPFFPADYNSIIVEVNTPLDGSKLGTTADLSNESYCTSGSIPAQAPFQVIDVGGGSNTPVLGSICYDPTSQLFRYPELTFVLGADSAFNLTPTASQNPFTCQTFTQDTGDANGSSFVPNHQYAIQMNTAIDVNDNEIALATPTDSSWSNGQFAFTTSGFDIMAAGYQDPNTGFFSYISKPYLGFLKDCPVNATFCNPVDGTFSNPDNALGAFGLNGNIPLRIFTTLAVASSGAGGLTTNVTLTRADGSTVPANVIASGARGHRMFYVAPPVSWEPGQTYTVTINANLSSRATGSNAIKLTAAPPPYTFTIPAATAGAVAIIPSGPDYVIYGGLNGLLGGGNPDGLNAFGIQFNVPIDGTTVNTTNVTVTDPSGASIAGTVALSSTVNFPGAATQEGAPSGNHEIVFQPTAVMKSNTTYTISASNLKLDPTATVPGLAAGAVIPSASGTFTTSDMNAQVYIDNSPNVQLDGLGPTVGELFWGFTREAKASTVTSSSVILTEVNQDGTAGATVPAANLAVSEVPLSAAGATSDLIWQGLVNYCTSSGATSCATTAPAGASPYLVKCSQNYSLAFATSITDEDETPVGSLTAQACTTGTTCSDVHTFTTAAFAPTFTYTPAAPTASPPTLDTFTVSFPGSLDHNAANGLIASTSQPFMQVVDSSGNAVAVTCANLADDTSSSINCTTPALAANASYTVSVVVPTSSACGPGTSSACPLPIAQVATFDTGFQDQSGNEIFDTLPADQVSCSFAGSLINTITTPCPQATATRTHHASKAKSLARAAKPNPNTLD